MRPKDPWTIHQILAVLRIMHVVFIFILFEIHSLDLNRARP